MYFLNTLAASAVLAFANAAALTSRTTGKATFYGGNVSGGTCSFVGYTIPSGLYGVAMGEVNWNGAEVCGACVEVTGPKGNKIVAQVVDQCPECDSGHLDLFSDAFAKLDDPSRGIIPISWNYVNCPISSPITLRNKEGTSPYWFSMQVINASKRVEKLEFSTDGGSSWTGTERKYYNYFEFPAGSKSSTVDVKVTSIDGDVLVVKNVGIGSGVTATASGNFGAGGSAPVEEAPKPVEESPESVEQVPAPAPAPTQAPAIIAKPVATQAPVPEVAPPAPTKPAEPVVNVKPAVPAKPEAQPVSTPASPEDAEVDDCAQEAEKLEAAAKAKVFDVKPTTLATSTTKAAAPLTTVAAVKHLATASTATVITITITGCPAPTATPRPTKRSDSSIFKRMLRL